MPPVWNIGLGIHAMSRSEKACIRVACTPCSPCSRSSTCTLRRTGGSRGEHEEQWVGAAGLDADGRWSLHVQPAQSDDSLGSDVVAAGSHDSDVPECRPQGSSVGSRRSSSTNTDAPDFASWCRRNSPLNSVLMGTAIAPSRRRRITHRRGQSSFRACKRSGPMLQPDLGQPARKAADHVVQLTVGESLLERCRGMGASERQRNRSVNRSWSVLSDHTTAVSVDALNGAIAFPQRAISTTGRCLTKAEPACCRFHPVRRPILNGDDLSRAGPRRAGPAGARLVLTLTRQCA
jgi:hypothetical protein